MWGRCWPWGPWFVFSQDDRAHLPRRLSLASLPPCPGALRWTSALEGQGPVTRLEAASPSGQTGPSDSTAPMNVLVPERNMQAVRGLVRCSVIFLGQGEPSKC